MADRVRATYRLDVDAAQVEERAEALHLEQTVELPREAVSDPFVLREVLARVAEIEADPAGGFRATLEYPAPDSALDPAQLLNLLFGNASLQPDVELTGVELPPAVEDALGGPRFGIEGLRKTAGVQGRPLTCTALKPMGLGPEGLAALAGTFASAGIDVIKDDHGLADHAFCPFEARVRACVRAVADSGALYVPNLTGSPKSLRRQLAFALDQGVRCVMTSPVLIGMPTFSELVRDALPVPVLAHPALAGAPRIAPAALLGTLFRAFGADAVIYPHFGGRFSYSSEVCRDLADRLRDPAPRALPALPIPAGGMAVERVPELVAFYGVDTMLLIGGSLYRAGSALAERSREFVEAVERA